MNEKDLLIIAHLRSNARVSLTGLSKKTKIPVSTLFDRLKSNERQLIVRHTSLLDFGKLGYHTKAKIMIKVGRDDRDGLKSYLLRHHAVNALCRINNGFDYMAECVFQQVRQMEEFMDDIESRFTIEERKSYFVIEDLRSESFMSDPELLPTYLAEKSDAKNTRIH